MTTARPPKATKPVTPMLNRPAYPHWMLTPSDMTAEISPTLRMVSATFQLWKKPTPSSSAPMQA